MEFLKVNGLGTRFRGSWSLPPFSILAYRWTEASGALQLTLKHAKNKSLANAKMVHLASALGAELCL